MLKIEHNGLTTGKYLSVVKNYLVHQFDNRIKNGNDNHPETRIP